MSGVTRGDRFIVINEAGHHFREGSEIVVYHIYEVDGLGASFLGKYKGGDVVCQQYLYWEQVKPLNIIEENE